MEREIKKDHPTMILNIIDCVLVFASWGIILAGAVMSPKTPDIVNYALKAFQLIVLGMNINALIKYRRQNSTIAGPILGIIGTGLVILSFIFALPSFVLMILAAIFVGTTKLKPARYNQNYNQDPNTFDPNQNPNNPDPNQPFPQPQPQQPTNNDPNAFQPNQDPNDPNQRFNDRF